MQVDFEFFILFVIQATAPSHSASSRSWNEAMDKFYNEVDLENVDVELEDILRTMPKTAKWAVDRVDVYGGGPTRRRYFQVMIYER